MPGCAGNQTGGEGAEGSLQSDRGGGEAGGTQQQIGPDQLGPRRLELVNDPIEGGSCFAAQDQCHHHKQNSGNHELDDGGDGQGPSRTQGHHDGQNDDSEDVIEHSRTDDDLPFAGPEVTQFSKHTGRDADARGRHRCPRKDRGDGIHVKDRHQPQRAKGEGQHHAHNRNREGLNADCHQLLEFTLETGEEEQRIQTKIGDGSQRPEGLVVDRGDLIPWNMCNVSNGIGEHTA